MQNIGTEPTGWRVPPAVAAIFTTVAIAVGLTHAIEVAALNLDGWRADIGMGVSPGWVPLVTGYHVSTLALGIAIAIAVAVLASAGKRRALRAIGGLACVAAVAELAIAVHDRGLAITLIGLAVIALVGGLVAFGRLPHVDRRAKWFAAPVGVAAVIAVGWPGIALAWADHTASHRDFTLSFRTASLADPVATRPGATPVDYDGKRYEIDHGDALLMLGGDIGAIELDGTSVELHVTNGARARELMRRSWHRITMLDALYLDNELVVIPQYRNVVGEHLAISLTSREAAEALYRQLVR